MKQTFHEARRVFVVTLGFNLLVALSKLGWGIYTHTLSMTADGFHSLLDAASNIIGIAGITLAKKPTDECHPYGHRKFEALAAMAISFFLFATGIQIIKEAFVRFISPESVIPHVGITSYAIILVTMAINAWVSRYELKKGKELGSDLLLADAEHTMSDLYASGSVLVSLVAIQLHFPLLDALSALVIVAMIVRAGYNIITAHLGTLVDAAVLEPKTVEDIVLTVPGVVSCHKIRSRGTASHIFLDLHVQVPPSLSIKEAHHISYQVEEQLKRAFDGSVTDVLVHVEEAD